MMPREEKLRVRKSNETKVKMVEIEEVDTALDRSLGHVSNGIEKWQDESEEWEDESG